MVSIFQHDLCIIVKTSLLRLFLRSMLTTACAMDASTWREVLESQGLSVLYFSNFGKLASIQCDDMSGHQLMA